MSTSTGSQMGRCQDLAVTYVDGRASKLSTLIDDRKRNVVRLERDIGWVLQYCS
jgi:hypothetical protein